MTLVTADQEINSLRDPLDATSLAHLLYILNKDLQDAKAAIAALSTLITISKSSPPPAKSMTNNAKIYFDPIINQLLVSQNGSPYDYLVPNSPACKLSTATIQAVHIIPTTLTFVTADVVLDPYGLFDGSSKIIFNSPGIWLIGAETQFAAFAGLASYELDILLNGVTNIAHDFVQTNNSGAMLSIVGIRNVNMSDYVQASAINGTGGDLNATLKRLWAIRIGGGLTLPQG